MTPSYCGASTADWSESLPQPRCDVNSAGVPRAIAPFAVVCFVLASACGPMKSSTLIVEATAELAAASTAQAPTVAPYEFIAAEEYLHKAREEQSYADFEVAEVLARKARDCARLARVKAEAQTRSEIGESTAKTRVRGLCRAGPRGGAANSEAQLPPAEPKSEDSQTKEDPTKKKGEPDDPLPAGEDPN